MSHNFRGHYQPDTQGRLLWGPGGGAGSWDIAAINREGMRRLGASGASPPPPREGEEAGREPLESPGLRGCLRIYHLSALNGFCLQLG